MKPLLNKMLVLLLALSAAQTVNASQPTDESARVDRSFSRVSACKTAIVEFFFFQGRLPRTNAEMPLCMIASDETIAAVEVRPADHAIEVEIRITYGSWAGPNNLLVIFGYGDERSFRFSCGAKGTTLPQSWLPASCPGVG